MGNLCRASLVRGLHHGEAGKPLSINKDWYATRGLKGAWQSIDRVPAEIAKLVSDQESAQISTIKELDVVVATVPSELIAFSGVPEWKPLVGTEVLYASISEGSVFTDAASGSVFVVHSGRWFKAPTLKGPWSMP